MSSGVAVYAAAPNGSDFVFLDLNRAGEAICGLRRNDVVGCGVADTLPGVRETGLLDVMRQVWRTGVAHTSHSVFYLDSNLAVWVENSVSRLPSGKLIVAFQDVTRRVLREGRQRGINRVLSALNRSGDRDDVLDEVARVIESEARCETAAICGIGDSPELARGFAGEPGRLLAGRPPPSCFWPSTGGRKVTSAARSGASCICELVAFGLESNSTSWITESGSFWTNNFSKLAPSLNRLPTEGQSGGRCRYSGSETVLVVPLRFQKETVGLLQITAKRANRLTLEIVRHIEDLAESVGIALVRIYARSSAGLALVEEVRARNDRLAQQDLRLREKSTAIRVMMMETASLKEGLKTQVRANGDQILMPIVSRLKRKMASVDLDLLEILEAGLTEISSPLGTRLSASNIRLTPREIEICNMVRHGLSTKDIAQTLHLSARTVDGHRNRIRRKLGLQKGGGSLASYLMSMSDDPANRGSSRSG